MSATACGRNAGAPPAAATGASPKKLTLSYPGNTKLVADVEIDAIAEGLPPNRKLDLVWGTVNGGWVIEDYYRFRGKKFTNTARPLAQAIVGSDGRVSVRFKVPEDYGGVHEVFLSDNGVPLAQGGIDVGQTFEMHPTEGPVGTPIEIRAKGLGWRTMESTWVVNWDNQEVGWVSATNTRGSAIARFRASGSIGEHQVKVYTGYMGQGYLNHEQAPNSYLPRPEFVFRVTPGNVAFAGVRGALPEAAGSAGNRRAAAPQDLSITPTQGPVLTRAVLKGSGLPANTRVSIVWETQEGNRVSGGGFAPKDNEIAKLTVGTDGRIDVPLVVPEDLGGLHSDIDPQRRQDPRAHSFRHRDQRGRHLACFRAGGHTRDDSSQGRRLDRLRQHLRGDLRQRVHGLCVRVQQPGRRCHQFQSGRLRPACTLSIFYPGIYQGPEGGQQLYRLPQLTYADDHPGQPHSCLAVCLHCDGRNPKGRANQSDLVLECPSTRTR